LLAAARRSYNALNQVAHQVEGGTMDSFQSQKDFFFEHWPAMKHVLVTSGPRGAIDWIESTFSAELERRVLFVFARLGVVREPWDGRSLDAYVPIAEAGIAECLRQAEGEADPEVRKRRINNANVISYNLGADLAFCWDDEFERTEDHFVRGEQSGEDCLRWRRQLRNPLYTFSMAHWLRGIHRLALGKTEMALSDFRDSLQYAELQNLEDGKPTEIAGQDGAILLGHGWVGLTRLILGDHSARPDYDRVMSIFNAQLKSDDEHVAGDAKWYLMQLEKVEKRSLGQAAEGS
jgi:hypothetical protein